MQARSRLYIGKLPIKVPAADVEAEIRKAGGRFGDIDSISLNPADDRLRKRHAGALHGGVAFVSFRDAAAVSAAAAELTLEIGGLKQLVQVERKAPLGEGGEAAGKDEATLAQEAEERQERREHSQRKHKRRTIRRVEGLDKILESIPPPGGRAAPKAVAYDLSLLAAAPPPSWEARGAGWAGAAAAPRQGEGAGGVGEASGAGVVDWESVHPAVDPQHGGGLGAAGEEGGGRSPTPRSLRKRLQVESFALVLRALAAGRPRGAAGLRVVDFGCGSGNLVLPLAFLFPECSFHAVDMKEASVRLLQRRAEEGSLANVTATVGMIEDHEAPFDVCLALHACGNATDHALLKAADRRAAFAVCPCCVGKLKFSLAGGTSYHYPRGGIQEEEKGEGGAPSPSQPPPPLGCSRVLEHSRPPPLGCSRPLEHPRSSWLRSSMASPAQDFAAVARAADISHAEGGGGGAQAHSHEGVARLCKLHVELDRIQAAVEAGYRGALLKLLEPSATAKSDLLVGVPGEGPWVGSADPTRAPPFFADVDPDTKLF